MLKGEKMKCKCVCPKCGEIVRTSSIGGFRHCGSQYNVQASLLAGEQAKYDKMVIKYAGEDKKEEKAGVEKPVEKIVEKIEEKKPPENIVAPIIEEKPEPKPAPAQNKPRKIRKPAVTKEKLVVEETANFGFF